MLAYFAKRDPQLAEELVYENIHDMAPTTNVTLHMLTREFSRDLKPPSERPPKKAPTLSLSTWLASMVGDSDADSSTATSSDAAAETAESTKLDAEKLDAYREHAVQHHAQTPQHPVHHNVAGEHHDKKWQRGHHNQHYHHRAEGENHKSEPSS